MSAFCINSYLILSTSHSLQRVHPGLPIDILVYFSQAMNITQLIILRLFYDFLYHTLSLAFQPQSGVNKQDFILPLRHISTRFPLNLAKFSEYLILQFSVCNILKEHTLAIVTGTKQDSEYPPSPLSLLDHLAAIRSHIRIGK